VAPAHDAGMMPEMTDRSPAERPTACPFLAFEDDRDYRSDRPDHRHRCFAEQRPAPRAISHQELFCLGGAFGECPTFASWAAREAAAVKRPTIRRTDAPATPRGSYPADRPSPGGAGGFAAVGGAYAAPPEHAMPGVSQPTGSPQPVPEWQAPPPWIAEAAAGAALAGAASSPMPAPPPAGPAGSPYAEDGETPAFLAGRTPRPTTSLPPPAAAPREAAAGMPAAGAASVAAAAGSAALIGGTSGGYEDDDLADSVSGGAAVPAAPVPPPAPRSSPTPSAQPVSGRTGPPPSGSRPAPSSDSLWVEPDVDVPAEDEPWEDPVEAAAAARIARAARESGGSGSSRFGLGRSRSSSSEQARPLPQRAADPAAPAWERPRRFEAYPAIKSSGGGPRRVPRGVPRVLMWAGLLALAALALFLIPPFLLGGGGGGGDAGASPTPAATAEVSAEPSVAPTPVPSPTPFTYKVKAGDTLSGIAAKYKVSVDDILAANPDLKDPNQLQVGQVLVIPLPASSVIPDAGTPEVTPAP
jgi:LysM repeat protein